MRATGLRRVALLLMPPIVVEAIRRLRRPKSMKQTHAPPPPAASPTPREPVAGPSPSPEWEMVADTDEVWTAHEGWMHDSILTTQLSKWQDFLRSVEGPRALGQSHEASAGAELDYATHNTIMSFGYALGRVAERRAAASVLDWGGGLGHYYVYARALFPGLKLDYVIKDFPGFCAAGERLLPDASYLSDEARALGRSYDLVFASSSLHYTRDYYGLLGRLCDSAAEWLMITRAPIVQRSDDFVVVQRPYMYGYMTEYPGWFINRQRLLDFVFARGFVLERQFLVAEEPNVPNAPERARYYGFLFRRASKH
jgi:putative methyltransferase (TIGR04325 family)